MKEEEVKLFKEKMKPRLEQFDNRVNDMKLFIKWALNKEPGKNEAICIKAMQELIDELKGKK